MPKLPEFIAKIKNIPGNFLTFLCYIIGMTPGISCLVVIYWFYDRNARDQSLERHSTLTYGICISAFITMCGILYPGIKSLLFIIPYSWGGYGEDGEWMNCRESVAGLLSFFASLFIVILFDKHEQLTDKVEYLERGKNKKNF